MMTSIAVRPADKCPSIIEKTPLEEGFTLIELVAVIVLIGLLAAAAVPRFVDLTTEARIASLRALKGAVESAANTTHAACAATEFCLNASWGAVIFVPALGQNVQILRGYPDAGEHYRNDQIRNLVDVSRQFVVTSENANTTTRWSVEGLSNCYVQYLQPLNVAGAAPTITMISSGC